MIIKFVFNKESMSATDKDNILLKFLYNVNYTMSPVCILSHDKSISNFFAIDRAKSYPFLHEIVSVFDINTAKSIDISQISFKNLYTEYNFYANNSVHFNEVLGGFFSKELRNVSNDFIKYLVVTNIIYNNFFLNLKYTRGLFEKLSYSFSLNFIFFYSLQKFYKSIYKVAYANINFAFDLSNVYNNSLNRVVVKNLYNTASNVAVLSTSNSQNYFKAILAYTNNFSKQGVILNEFKDWSLTISKSFFEKVSNTWTIRFSGSDITKYINGWSLNNFNVYFLRKSKVFNKGRYSRNRQTYRTGVYWSLYVNIVAMIGLPYWFYRFTINFGYVWWMLYIFIASFFVSKAIKYKFYNPCVLFKSFISDVLWLGYQFNIIIEFLTKLISSLLAVLKKFI